MHLYYLSLRDTDIMQVVEIVFWFIILANSMAADDLATQGSIAFTSSFVPWCMRYIYSKYPLGMDISWFIYISTKIIGNQWQTLLKLHLFKKYKITTF